MSVELINQTTPMAVLSVASGRGKWLSAPVFGAAIAQGIILATLFTETSQPADQANVTTIEMIQVAPASHPEADAEPPTAPAPIIAMTAEPTVPETPQGNSLPANASPAPSPDSPPEPEAAPVAEQASVAEPSTQPAVTPDAPTPMITDKPLPFPSNTAATKVFHPKSLVAAPRHSASTAAMTRPTAAKPGNLAATTSSPQPAANGDAAIDRQASATLTEQIRNAVQAAVQCPAAARMMAQSGKAAVTFDYRDGALVGGLQISQSSGVPILDVAALSAVRSAHYPKAPHTVFNQVLHLLVWVEEACVG